MPNKRDDFSEKTKRLIANRAGVRCSNPDCRKPTSGSNRDPNKITNIGVAAHICAAALGGPRYDPTMTVLERKSSQNGIWLCQSCAKLIDSDPQYYSKEVLYAWKRYAELTSESELKSFPCNGVTVVRDKKIPDKYVNAKWFGRNDNHAPFTWMHSKLDKECKVTEGSVVLVSGCNGSGVDVFARNVVSNSIKADCRVIYFNLKESSSSVVNSMIASESLVSINRISRGQLTDVDWKRIVDAVIFLQHSKLILEHYDFDNPSMADYFISAIQKGNADIIVLDDIDGLGISDPTKLSSFLYQLRNAAIQSGTVVFIILDWLEPPNILNKRPSLSELPIGRFTKFCDVIQFLHQNKENCSVLDETQTMELIIAKNYYSTQRSIFYWAYLPDTTRFVEYQQEEPNERSILDKYPGLIAGLKTYVDNIE